MGDHQNHSVIQNFVHKVWAETGRPSDFEILEKTEGVEIIDRATRLANDRENGQLKEDYTDLPSPWKSP
ncbi:MAG: hypothetical protein ACRBDL_01905 [Alphaproteobacteria bacterium]